MRKRILGLVAWFIAIALLSSMMVAAQEAQPQADAGTQASDAASDSSGDSAGDSSGESGEFSEEDYQAMLQAIMQEAGNSEGTETDSTEGTSDGSGNEALDNLMQLLMQYAGNVAGESEEGASTGEAAGASTGEAAGDSTSEAAGNSAGSSGSEGGLYGKPWVNSIDAGNLPEEAPKPVDDLLMSCTYDILKEHQDGSEYNGMLSTAYELKEFLLSYIQDDANNSHDMQQLRIFFNQAADFDALKEAGIDGLKPYLDMIAGAQSIEELNAVLASEDFPFNPWLQFYVGSLDQDREENNHVFVYPKFLFVEPMQEESLVDSDDFMVQTMRSSMLMQKSLPVTDALVALGVPSEEASAASMKLLDLEKSYGKYCDLNNERFQEYGVYAESVTTYGLEDLAAVSPDFPLCDILVRFGKDKAAGFSFQVEEWIEALNNLWNEDNLELLKQISQVKILMECKNYLDPEIFRVSQTALQMDDPEPQQRAYEACDSIYTFSQVLAKTFVEEHLGQETVDRLTEMSQGLIDTYKTLVNSSSWLGDESKQKVIEKLDNMKLNILYPEGGYFNYDNLELIPTEEGGTLIGNYLKLLEYKNLCENELLDQKARCVLAWLAFKPTMSNAFYSEFDNSINIMPGIVTSNLYSNDMSDSAVLGRIGYCVGHEISHGFDFRGSQMDKYGMKGSIFTEEDVEGFLKICDALAAYYDSIEYADGQYVNGKRVNVEAASDLSGMQVVLTYAKTLPDYDLTELFKGASECFVSSGPAGLSYAYVVLDNHPLGYLRVNVNARMFDEFYDTYDCQEGDNMYLAPENRIRFWGE